MSEAWGLFEDADAPQAKAAEAGPAVGQYLAFRLGREEYAVDVLRVQEIRGMCAVTSIPNARPWVLGMMNLRGAVVAVLDLRAKLGMASRESEAAPVIVVLCSGEGVVGAVVDAVTDVLDLPRSIIQPPPELGGDVDVSMIRGVAELKGRLVALLELDRVLETSAVAA
jgi:purine-binding chemotaxis protein CheW